MDMPADTPLPWPDARRAAAPIKGRGTATRVEHRFAATERRADGGSLDVADHDTMQPDSRPPTQVVPEQARSILSRNDSPDVPFTWAINPYRGCEHGCIYCYARPTHAYLDLSPGLDFETRLVAKVNAADLLLRELAKPGYEPSPIAIGSATDAYQPIEREWGLTRSVVEVLDAVRHPFSIVTKSATIERDIDLLASAARRQQAYVMVSVTTLDAALSRRLEPRAASPARRLQTVRRLVDAGVPVGVNVAPIIPFLNEPEIERIVEAAVDAGASRIHYTVVRLPWEVAPLFTEWLQHHVPDRAERIVARIRDLHGDQLYRARFGERMKGDGIWAQLIRGRIERARRAHGVSGEGPALALDGFEPPRRLGGQSRGRAPDVSSGQGTLF